MNTAMKVLSRRQAEFQRKSNKMLTRKGEKIKITRTGRQFLHGMWKRTTNTRIAATRQQATLLFFGFCSSWYNFFEDRSATVMSVSS